MSKIYLASPHMSEEGYELEYVQDAYDKNWIAPLGENIDEFEKAICETVDTTAALALNSGTAAIHLALLAAGVGEGDVVLCQTLTFCGSANPIKYVKATPIFIDSERGGWNMDPALVEKAINKYRPKAVIVVHLYGMAARIDLIKSICVKYGVFLIEDAAESLGTIYKGKWTGTYGHFGIYSFNGNKIITTSGGGMLVSENREMIEKARFWSTQAREPFSHYEHKEVGFNYRLSNVLAGIGRGQMKVLEKRVQQKRHIFKTYYEGLSDIPEIKFFPELKNERANYWLTPILIQSNKVTPDKVIEALNRENIESRPIWKPMHLQPLYEKYDFVGSSIAEEYFNHGVCLPSDTKMNDADLEKVIQIIRGLFTESKELKIKVTHSPVQQPVYAAPDS